MEVIIDMENHTHEPRVYIQKLKGRLETFWVATLALGFWLKQKGL
jgi:hypothetical protein